MIVDAHERDLHIVCPPLFFSWIAWLLAMPCHAGFLSLGGRDESAENKETVPSTFTSRPCAGNWRTGLGDLLSLPSVTCIYMTSWEASVTIR